MPSPAGVINQFLPLPSYLLPGIFRSMACHPAFPPEKREQAKTMYIQGFLPARIAQALDLKVASVHTWANRGRWRLLRDKIALQQSNGQGVPNVIDRTDSARLRSKLSDSLELHADTLIRMPIKPELNALTKSAAIIESLARSAKIVHDWGQGGASGLILVEQLRRVEPARVDAPAALQDAPGAVDAACVNDTPTGSVPEPAPIEPMPQVAQPIDATALALLSE